MSPLLLPSIGYSQYKYVISVDALPLLYDSESVGCPNNFIKRLRDAAHT